MLIPRITHQNPPAVNLDVMVVAGAGSLFLAYVDSPFLKDWVNYVFETVH